MLLPYLTLVTPVAQIESDYHFLFQSSFNFTFRFTSGMKVPGITNEADKLIQCLTWGISKSPGNKYSTYWVPVEGILKNRQTRALIRCRRCVILTNCIFIRYKRENILLYNPKEKVIFLAGIWKSMKSRENSFEDGFSIITRPSPVRLANLSERLPLILHRNRIRTFLNSERPMMDISGILNDFHYPELNGYPLNDQIIAKTEWERKDLLPAGNKLFLKQESTVQHFLLSRNYFW